MSNQTQNNQPLNNHPQAIQPPAPGGGSSAPESASLFKLTWRFAIGFLGWYLVMAFVFWALLGYTFDTGQKGLYEGIVILNGICIFPAQILTLVILFLVRSLREIGWGMLTAIGVNLLISLVLGLVSNSICFIPFFIPIIG